MTSKHLDRRQVLAAAAAGLATSMGGTISKSMAQEPGDGSYNTFAPSGVTLGPKESFSFDLLAERAKANAGSPWEPTPVVASEILERIDYDAFQKIRYRTEMSLMLNHGRTLPVQLFHLGKFSRDPVKIHLVEGDETQEVLYNSALFNTPEGHPARDLPQGIGFAGFRVMDANLKTDWLAFLGASYFRSSGPFNQYGISARGLAINTGATTPEEFPRFTDFWLDSTEEDTVVVYAHLDSESVTGAYRMTARRTLGSDNVYRVVQDIEARLFARRDIGRLGVAPFSSMYWYGATNRRQVVDWRPEIHDSDGVAVWTGAGERIWRPLNNPPRVMVNAFIDRDVRGFGLLQRDRDFVHYLDDSVFYERRPSTWVEPLAPFGQGAVHLLEIPTDDEIHDNIAAYWCPDGLFAAGESRTYSYRLSWLDSIPFPDTLAKTTGTWTGIGGRPGHKRPEGVRKFVVDFQGAILNDLGRNDGVEMIVTPARGILSNAYCHPVVDQQGRWRALFDLDVSGSDPVDIRMFLRKGARALTETWVFQYFPEST